RDLRRAHGRPDAPPPHPRDMTMPGTSAQKTTDAPPSAGFLGPDRTWHLGAGLMTLATVVAFTIWAFTHTGTNVNAFLLILAIAFGLFMAFNIGRNDVANSIGTSVGAGTLDRKQARVVGALADDSGAEGAGRAVPG